MQKIPGEQRGQFSGKQKSQQPLTPRCLRSLRGKLKARINSHDGGGAWHSIPKDVGNEGLPCRVWAQTTERDKFANTSGVKHDFPTDSFIAIPTWVRKSRSGYRTCLQMLDAGYQLK